MSAKASPAARKQILTSFRVLSAIALFVLTVDCANIQSKENSLVSAGFRVIAPKTPTQEQKLKALPPGKVAMVQTGGKTYYVFPDAAHNRAYVGGPKQYEAYRQIRLKKELAVAKLEAAEMNLDESMNWNMWGGWGAWDTGWY